MNNPQESAKFQSPGVQKFRLRQFSTADKYSNLEMTAQKIQQLIHQNQLLKQCLSDRGINPEQTIQTYSQTNRYVNKFQLNSPGNQILLWDLEKKNQFLSKKLQKLKLQKNKQSDTFNKIKSSSKWKKTSQCGACNCYKDKYIRFLRITSPSTQF